VLCLKAGVAAPKTTPDMVKTAFVQTLKLDPSVQVDVSAAVDKCTDNKSWQSRISVWNTGTAETSASEIASKQVRTACITEARPAQHAGASAAFMYIAAMSYHVAHRLQFCPVMTACR
jgi:hypothetical protein